MALLGMPENHRGRRSLHVNPYCIFLQVMTFIKTSSLLLYLWLLPSQCSSWLRQQIVLGKVEKIHCSLECFGDSQLQTTLLWLCISLPKFNYTLWTCSPSLVLHATTPFDNSIGKAVDNITGGPLSNWFWSKANLPCSMGGLNLRSAVLHTPAAYIAPS